MTTADPREGLDPETRARLDAVSRDLAAGYRMTLEEARDAVDRAMRVGRWEQPSLEFALLLAEGPRLKAVRDLGYDLAKTLGMLWLAKRLGLRLKPWVQIRDQADKH